MSAGTHDLFGGTGVDALTPGAREELAREALKEFRKMQAGLNAYARMLTRKPEIRIEVSATTNGATDGKKIYYRPPLELGLKPRHDRAKCDKRDKNKQLLCPACASREAVLVVIYHEIAHVAHGSFRKVTDDDLITFTEESVRKTEGVFAEKILQKIRLAPYHLKYEYMPLAHYISEWLPIILNAIEDARVNREMFKARPGTKVMFDGLIEKIMAQGVEQPNKETGDIEHVMWSKYPLNLQMIVGVFCKASGYTFSDWFCEKVETDLEDKQLAKLMKQVDKLRNASGSYHLAFPILSRLRELGYCILPDDPEEPEDEQPEPDSESEPDPDGDPGESEDVGPAPEDSEDEGEDGTGSSDGESEGTSSEPDDGSSEDDPGTGPGDSSSGDAGDGGEQSDDEDGVDSSDSSERSDSGDGGTSPSDEESTEEGSDGDAAEEGSSDQPDGDSGSSEGSETGGSSDGDGADDSDSEAGKDSGQSEGSDGDVGSPDGDRDNQEGSSDGRDASGDNGDEGDGESAGGSLGSANRDASGGRGDDVDSSGSDGASPDDGEAVDGSEGDSDTGDSPDGSNESDRSDRDSTKDRPGNDGEPEESDDPTPEGDSSTGDGEGRPDASRTDSSESGPRGDEPSTDADGDRTEDGDQTEASLPEDGADEALDLGKDAGKGGTRVIWNDDKQEELPYGTPEEGRAALLKLGDHDDPPAEVRESQEAAIAEAFGKAIIQGMYFETPSSAVRGVREHYWEKPIMQGGRNLSSGWDVSRQDLYAGYSRIEQGMDGDFKVGDEILGKALLRLRKAFADNARGGSDRHRKSGRVDSRSLGKRAPLEDPRLFMKKNKVTKKSYEVVLGLDISGSTRGINIALIKKAAYAQATLCARLGIPFSVFAHSGNFHEINSRYDGGIDLDMYHIKDRDEPWNERTIERLEKLGPAEANLDGHTIEYYRKLIEGSKATEKVIMYYTDGQMPAENHDEELEILQREIRTCKRLGITLMGVGVRTDSPLKHGLDTVQIDEDADIIRVVAHLEKRIGNR
jgi:hypothetical protein